MKNYLERHRFSVYLPTFSAMPGLTRYENSQGWQDYYIGDKMLFSHRKTVYDQQTFPEKLHSHSFYEVDIYIEGGISYIADKKEFYPVRDNILIFPPGCQHTARMQEGGPYARYVFYFDPAVLDFLGRDYLSDVFRYKHPSCLRIEHTKRAEFYYLRERLMDVLHSEEKDAAAQAFSHFVNLMLLISAHTQINHSSITEIPQKVLDIKHYVDHNFKNINTTADIAAHFFYSREYVSRVFKQYYSINLSEHLVNQKINHAKELLEQGNSASYAYTASGFRSMSAFVTAFRARTGMTPAEYKRAAKSKK